MLTMNYLVSNSPSLTQVEEVSLKEVILTSVVCFLA